MIDFQHIYNCISIQVTIDETSVSNGIEFQAYRATNPCTIIMSSKGRPLMKIQHDASGIFTLYFQKKDIPYEIGYTGCRFQGTDTIDKLFAKDILKEYPIVKEVYEHLITLFNEREDKQND